MKMKKIIWFGYLWLGMISMIFAQNNDKEYWRQKGYEAKEAGRTEKAITYYAKVLDLDPGDYDACLALARLYFDTERYEKSASCYRKMLRDDPEDVEALHGLGKIMLYTDRYGQAEKYLQRAIALQPDYMAPYFDLAKAYAWSGRLRKAMDIYRQILDKDETYSEAWQGLGKMYYWNDRPRKAMTYYEKALKWDPENDEIRREYAQIRRSFRWNTGLTAQMINEEEESYQIDAVRLRWDLSKRLNDLLEISAHTLGDRSYRVFNTGGDTLRYYNATWMKVALIFPHQRLTFYGGYSPTDARPSAYGLHWKAVLDRGTWQVKQDLDAGYDYFYYWNMVGQNRVEENLRLIYKKWELDLSASGGIVDRAPIADVPAGRFEDDVNPFYGYGLGVNYRILKKPLIKAGLDYGYLTYTYKSPRYYSPLGRQTYGGNLSVLWKTDLFYFYAGGSYHLGSEYYWEETAKGNGNGNGNGGQTVLTKTYIPAGNWSASVEAGYMPGAWEFSIFFSRFRTPYYANMNGGIRIMYAFDL